MSAAKPMSRDRRIANYGIPLTVAQRRQLRKTDLRRGHERPRKQRVHERLLRRLRRERWAS
jgi:hypothetical protein